MLFDHHLYITVTSATDRFLLPVFFLRPCLTFSRHVTFKCIQSICPCRHVFKTSYNHEKNPLALQVFNSVYLNLAHGMRIMINNIFVIIAGIILYIKTPPPPNFVQ
jgi:hypothetical protein